MPGTCAATQHTWSPRRHGSHLPQCPPYQPIPTRWPAFHCVTPSPATSTTPTISCPGTRGYSIPGNTPYMVTESLWHTPQACTRTRTSPAAGSGTGRLTSSSGPPGFTTCAYLPSGITTLLRPPLYSLLINLRAIRKSPRSGYLGTSHRTTLSTNASTPSVV